MKLMSRYWQITDANGDVQEVVGDGVVGQQPVIEPGEGFEYTSSAVIRHQLERCKVNIKWLQRTERHLIQKFRFFIFRFREPYTNFLTIDPRQSYFVNHK